MQSNNLAYNKLRALILLLACLCIPAKAQTAFLSEDLPHQPGQYCRAFFSTNVNIAAFIGQTNGPQRWDFSQPQQPDELIQRTDIVTPDDGGNGASFPAAAYAERDTDEPSSEIAWRYYSLTNQGRLYYGFYNPVDDPVTPLVVYDQPTLDVPAVVQFGQIWSRSVNWTNVVSFVEVIDYHFTANASVDAFGTLVLPQIGEVPALRVTEIHDYEATWEGFGPIVSQTNVFCYWLSPYLGIAAQTLEFGENTLFPAPLDETNACLRVFESSSLTNLPSLTSVNGLRLHVQTGSAMLNWNQNTNCAAFHLESTGSLNSNHWQFIGLSITNTWSDPLMPTQKFYRVFSRP